MIIVGFLLIGAFFIISNNNLYMINEKDVNIFYEKYRWWFGDIGSNTISITSNIVKMRWLPNS